MKNKILHLTLFLAVVSAIAGGALAFANEMTAPVIAANAEKEEKQSLLEMYPDAQLDDFELVNDPSLTENNPEIQKIYKYKDGIVIFKCAVSGFDKGTEFLVAINSGTDTVDQFKAISNGDTKGIGSKITEDAFKQSVTGKKASEPLDTISGENITSSQVVQAINTCAKAAASIK